MSFETFIYEIAGKTQIIEYFISIHFLTVTLKPLHCMFPNYNDCLKSLHFLPIIIMNLSITHCNRLPLTNSRKHEMYLLTLGAQLESRPLFFLLSLHCISFSHYRQVYLDWCHIYLVSIVNHFCQQSVSMSQLQYSVSVFQP